MGAQASSGSPQDEGSLPSSQQPASLQCTAVAAQVPLAPYPLLFPDDPAGSVCPQVLLPAAPPPPGVPPAVSTTSQPLAPEQPPGAFFLPPAPPLYSRGHREHSDASARLSSPSRSAHGRRRSRHRSAGRHRKRSRSSSRGSGGSRQRRSRSSSRGAGGSRQRRSRSSSRGAGGSRQRRSRSSSRSAGGSRQRRSRSSSRGAGGSRQRRSRSSSRGSGGSRWSRRSRSSGRSRQGRHSRSPRCRSPSTSRQSFSSSISSSRRRRRGRRRRRSARARAPSAEGSAVPHASGGGVGVPPIVVPSVSSGPGIPAASSSGGSDEEPVGDRGEQTMSLVQSSAPTKWTSHGCSRPVVWLLGNSYISQAAQRAEIYPGGRNLGFQGVELFWRGIGGLRWPQVLTEVVSISRLVQGPVLLAIHAGGNDLCSTKLAELLMMMRADMVRFPSFFPKLFLLWSEIVPRAVWTGARDAKAVEKARRNVNARISRFVRFRSGVVVRHRQLEGDNSAFMKSDGVHLSDAGLDIFLFGLQDGIKQGLVLMDGGRSPV